MVAALPSTIVYTLNPERKRTTLYDIKLLTVVVDHSSDLIGSHLLCTVGSGDNVRKGTAGHVALTYSSGGQLVTSNGHWIELTRVDTNLESVMRVAARNFGGAEVESFQDELNCASNDSERMECTQKRAHKYVQQSVCTRMKSRTKY